MEMVSVVSPGVIERLPDIRYLSAASECPIVLAAEYTRNIYAVSIDELKTVSRFRTILDWGGRRIAVGQDGNKCAVGNYFEGVALYEVLSGTEIWRRQDLKQVQYLAMGRDRKTIYCGFEKGPGQVISIDSGKTLRLLRGVKKLYESPYADVSAWLEAKAFIVQNSRIGSTCRIGIRGPIRDVAFFPNRICVAGTELHCYDEEGVGQWDVALPSGQLATSIRFLHDGRLFGVMRNLEIDELHLVEFDGKTGERVQIADLGTAELAVFCFEEKLLCSDGRLWDVASGNFVTSVWDCSQPFDSANGLSNQQ